MVILKREEFRSRNIARAVLLSATVIREKKYISADRNSNRHALPPQAHAILIAFLSKRILVPFTLDTRAA